MKYVDENALRQNITETKDYVDNHGFASDRTPVGTIISVGCDSSLIPSSTIKYPTDDYFICKGTTLNIAEYPALADYFEDAFGSKNYFGGDGTTTFKVPDFTTDFPTNGILAIKAQMTSTQITYAEVNDNLTTANNVWSAEKVRQELSKIGEWVEGTYPSDRTSRNINTSGGAIVAQITLTKGIWLISCGGYISGLTQNIVTTYGIVPSESHSITQVAGIGQETAAICTTNNSTGYTIGFASIPMSVDANSKTFYFKIFNTNGGYNSGGCNFKAVRIA